ncbi:hypothetical protein D0U04_23800 [Bacillus clarus]|uniref:Uncharacterized protein n=1 Tax=Bacillus clarus TaxID=2338372 RepID=A0A090Z261_9BACI|nr:hypothetical protein [Bacillus clarus]KFN04717.1 hypothetical protein DJ93_5903 [Bacillus clarus]RFT63896.1 hypothetical protein D0U04_23800 [Bacillus clarus]
MSKLVFQKQYQGVMLKVFIAMWIMLGFSGDIYMLGIIPSFALLIFTLVNFEMLNKINSLNKLNKKSGKQTEKVPLGKVNELRTMNVLFGFGWLVGFLLNIII